MSETASTSGGIAERYATAVFELARDAGSLEQIENDCKTLRNAISESEDFRNLIHSPLYSREDQSRALDALAGRMGLSDLMTRSLKLLSSKRRLFVLNAMCAAIEARIRRERGEVTAKVTSAQSLSDEQREKLAQALKGAVGRDVDIDLEVDESLIGGLVVKVGSKMIDTSIRSRLEALRNTMREVG